MKEITSILACPNCHEKIKSNLICNKCGERYYYIKDIPCFIEKYHEKEDYAKETIVEKFNRTESLRRIVRVFRKYLSPPDTSFRREITVRGIKSERNLSKVLSNSSNKRILNIGASSAKSYKNMINLDIGPYSGVDIIADGKKLPFQTASFDLVLIEMVLEHVDEPEKIISEASRVLKKGGKLYISIPFVFAFHGSPNDFNRMTLEGVRKRLENNNLKLVDSGILSGPSSTLSQIMRYYLAIIFSFNNDLLFSVMLNIFGWITFPIKYLDIFVNKHKKAHMIAASIYGIGEKQ